MNNTRLLLETTERARRGELRRADLVPRREPSPCPSRGRGLRSRTSPSFSPAGRPPHNRSPAGWSPTSPALREVSPLLEAGDLEGAERIAFLHVLEAV